MTISKPKSEQARLSALDNHVASAGLDGYQLNTQAGKSALDMIRSIPLNSEADDEKVVSQIASLYETRKEA